MEAVRNRVIEGMEDWLQREKNMARLFSPNTLQSRYFQQLKVDYLRDMHKQIRKGATRDERMTLHMLKGEMKDIEKWLYWHPLERLLRRMGRAIKDLLAPRPKTVIAERTNWMMKVNSSTGRKEQKDVATDTKLRPEQVYKQKIQKPELLEKKRVSVRKGLKI